MAIKELHDVAEGSSSWHRARREMEALVRPKEHPRVVSVEEIIEGPIGPCLVMEYLSEGSLADRLDRRGALSINEVVFIGQCIVQALMAAHLLGMIHRDIKPQNVLVSCYGQVKVCDFGISAFTHDDRERTQAKAITLAYASPEELDRSEAVGTAADVYSFSATMLHLSTGHRLSFQERLAGETRFGRTPSQHWRQSSSFCNEACRTTLTFDPNSRSSRLCSMRSEPHSV